MPKSKSSTQSGARTPLLQFITGGQQAQEKTASQKTVSKNFAMRPGHLVDDLGTWVDIELIDDNPYQPRDSMDAKELADMAASFEIDGQQSPAKARVDPNNPNRYQLAFGHCRKQTVRNGHNAGTKRPEPERYKNKLRIEVQQLTDEEMLRESLNENNRRSGFNVIERGRGYVKLRELTTRQLLEQGEGSIYEGNDKTEHLEIDGQRWKLAPWRTVAERNGENYKDMHRLAQIVQSLPQEWLHSFVPDTKNPDAFVLNSRHGRLLVSLRDSPKIQQSIYNQILRDRLAATEAERRVQELRKNEQAALDPGLTAALKTELAKQANNSRSEAKQKNAAAQAAGKSHIQSVGATAPAVLSSSPQVAGNGSASPLNERDINIRFSNSIGILQGIPQELKAGTPSGECRREIEKSVAEAEAILREIKQLLLR